MTHLLQQEFQILFMTQTQSPSINNETANAWAASLGDDLWGNDLPGVRGGYSIECLRYCDGSNSHPFNGGYSRGSTKFSWKS